MNEFSCVRQRRKKDCAIACIATILKHHGIESSMSKVRKMAGVDKKGTSVAGIINALEQFGFEAYWQTL